MAEFCKKCASKLGMRDYDRAPLFCENCETYIPSKWQRMLSWLKFKKK